jgi:hypothetical protein
MSLRNNEIDIQEDSLLELLSEDRPWRIQSPVVDIHRILPESMLSPYSVAQARTC